MSVALKDMYMDSRHVISWMSKPLPSPQLGANRGQDNKSCTRYMYGNRYEAGLGVRGRVDGCVISLSYNGSCAETSEFLGKRRHSSFWQVFGQSSSAIIK